MISKRLPHGSSLAAAACRSCSISGDEAICVASFNLLAPLYIRPIDNRTGKVQPFASFDWISDDDSDRLLGNASRLPKLLGCLENCQADFICVQELQLERANLVVDDKGDPSHFDLPGWIMPLVTGSGYGVILPPQQSLEKIAQRNRRVLSSDSAITNAIFYQEQKWATCNDRDMIADNTCVIQSFVPSGESDAEPITISSIHLDANDEEKRVLKLQRCLELAPKFSPLVIAGDFNAEMLAGSCCHALLSSEDLQQTSQPLPPIDSEQLKIECTKALRMPVNSSPPQDEMTKWREMYDSARKFANEQHWNLSRADTGPTRAAFDHDKDSREMAQWRLDHILYTSTTLTPIARWSTLEDDEYSRTLGLPNDKVPSDHLPIAVVFERRNHVRLSSEARRGLIDRIKSMDARHGEEQANLAEDSAEKLSLLKGQSSNEHEAYGEKKKKRQKPSPAIMEQIRSGRAAMKVLKRSQSAEREGLMSGLTVLEKMELNHYHGDFAG